MNKIKYVLFLLIIFLSPLVYAQDFNVSNSDITSPNSSGSGKYTGTEIYNSGTSNVYNIGTRYNGRLSRIVFNLVAGGYAESEGFEKGHTYTLTMNMATEDWRNHFGSVSVKCEGSSGTELSSGAVTFVSMKKIKFSFTTPTDTYCQFVYIDLKSTNISSTAFTGDSNWNLSSLVISDPTYGTGSGSGSGSGSTNDDIINNQNNNTDDIINNQNENTNNIIENNNQNTQDIINNANENQTCPVGPLILTRDEFSSVGNKYLSSDGSETSNSSYSISDYLIVKPNTSYTITLSNTSQNVYYCLYSPSKILSSCAPLSSREINFTTGSNVNYLRISLGGSRVISLKGPVCNNWEQETSSFITDDSDPSMSDNEITSIFSNVGYTDPLNYLLQLPTLLINKIVSLSDTCQQINLGQLYGVSIIFPCINLENILGSSVWNTIDVICTVGLLVVIFKNLYQTFANLMTMGGEKEAREKFNMPTPMEFLSYILGGDK